MNYTIIFRKKFTKRLKKLSKVDQKLVKKAIELLENDPSHPSLRTKKMEGKIRNYECRANDSIRLIWFFEEDKIIVMLDVGHHDIERKYS